MTGAARRVPAPGSLFWRAAVTGITLETAAAWAEYLTYRAYPWWALALPVGMTAGAVIVRAGLRGAYGARS